MRERRRAGESAAAPDHDPGERTVAVVDLRGLDGLDAAGRRALSGAHTIAPVWGRATARRLATRLARTGPVCRVQASGPDAAVPPARPTPLVSLVLPVLDAQRYLDQTLAAVRAQTFRDFELIVVDDASSDDSLAVARRGVEGIPAARIVSLYRNTRKRGAVAVGVALASGRYVMEINADDVLEPDALERLTQPVRTGVDADCVFGDHRVIDEAGAFSDESARRRSRATGRADLRRGWVREARPRQLAAGLVPAGVCAIVRRDAIGAWPRFTDTHTDYWLAWRGVRRERVWFVGAPPLARYREHADGITREFHARRKSFNRVRMDLRILLQARPAEAGILCRRLAVHAFGLVVGPRVRRRIEARSGAR